MALLNDRKTYEVLIRNPVPVIEKRLNSFIWKLWQKEKNILQLQKPSKLWLCASSVSRGGGVGGSSPPLA